MLDGNAIPDMFGALAQIIVDIGQYLSNPDNLAAIGAKAWDIGKALVNGIWEGIQRFWSTISEGLPGLVEALTASLNFSFGGSSGLALGSIPGHASGLNYVPYDNYLARLHRGEMVLTSAEAAAYRSGKAGQSVKQFIMNIYTQSLSKEELDSIVEYMNRKLGDDL